MVEQRPFKPQVQGSSPCSPISHSRQAEFFGFTGCIDRVQITPTPGRECA